LAGVLSRCILADSDIAVHESVLQSIRGYADIVVAARKVRERLSLANERAVETLTDTELVLLRSVASGKSNGQIAKERGVTRNAVERRLMSAYGKLGVRTRAEAVAKLNPAKN
jgi:DNA-binding NarL/FixJ family response regulator